MKLEIIRSEDPAPAVIEVRGHLVGAAAGRLLTVCQSFGGRLPTLDLERLGSADMGGLDTLRRLGTRGFRLRGLSPEVELLLKNGSLRPRVST